MTATERGSPWNEREIRAAAEAYFDLLARQLAGEKVNKAAVYRQLHSRFPNRSVKSFELKFQNISAVLYESKRAYAVGLKPLSNYQAALKPIVLEIADRAGDRPRPAIEVLCDRLRVISALGAFHAPGGSAGRHGLELERLLSIPANSSKAPDFMGIELKTKLGKTLQTLFSLVPTEYVAVKDKAGLLERYGRLDGRRRLRLYTSFSSEPDTFGFRLSPNARDITVLNRSSLILSYAIQDLEASLTAKHTETAFIPLAASSLPNGGVTFDRLLYCKTPSIRRFTELCKGGNVFLDFTISKSGNRVKDHGFLWRMPTDHLPKIFAESREIRL